MARTEYNNRPIRQMREVVAECADFKRFREAQDVPFP
jgi:hypothetical protein